MDRGQTAPNPAGSLEGARVVVTGAAGFIGGHLVRALAGLNVDRVVALDRRPVVEDPYERRERRDNEEVQRVTRNLLDPLVDVVDGADVVFHLAAHVSVAGSVRDPLTDCAANVQGTLALLEACRTTRVPRFIYSSSAAVYGSPRLSPIDEDHPTCPESPYGLSKLTGERYARLYDSLYGMSVCALRYFNVYGPNQPASGGYAAVIPLFLRQVRERSPLSIEGDGLQTRDFVHVSDVVAANLLAATSPYRGVVNVGSGTPTSILDLARVIGGDAYPIKYLPARIGDIRDSLASVERARVELGFVARTSLERGLARQLTKK